MIPLLRRCISCGGKLKYPVHLKVIRAVHLIHCYHIIRDIFILRNLISLLFKLIRLMVSNDDSNTSHTSAVFPVCLFHQIR